MIVYYSQDQWVRTSPKAHDLAIDHMLTLYYSYDGSAVNGLQLLDTWQDYFGSPEGAKLGLLATGTRLGQIASIPFISPLIQRLGRRWPILIGSIIVLIGVAIQASAQSFAMFTVGRVVLGFGNNIQECTCPLLVSELAHPRQRPQITAIMNTTSSIGQIIAAWVTFGTAQLMPSEWSWRLPTLIQAVSRLMGRRGPIRHDCAVVPHKGRQPLCV